VVVLVDYLHLDQLKKPLSVWRGDRIIGLHVHAAVYLYHLSADVAGHI
jgi:hypothetical protein